ncbi:hypothetical protein M5K25_002322 [Dendrobium thyrsiflorum]|uniref:Uncharacterized protein n=1 Tax=Dendrobium thyrsiflorum TaxID=117978 RepID=A0ABD0VSM4_DENTH
MVGEWMMDPIKIPWFRHPGSSWSLVYLVRGGSRPNLTEGSLSAAMGCFVQGYLVDLEGFVPYRSYPIDSYLKDLMPLGSTRALAITIIWWCHLAANHLVQRAPSHNRLSCGAIWRQNRRSEDTYHVLTGKRLFENGSYQNFGSLPASPLFRGKSERLAFPSSPRGHFSEVLKTGNDDGKTIEQDGGGWELLWLSERGREREAKVKEVLWTDGSDSVRCVGRTGRGLGLDADRKDWEGNWYLALALSGGVVTEAESREKQRKFLQAGFECPRISRDFRDLTEDFGRDTRLFCNVNNDMPFLSSPLICNGSNALILKPISGVTDVPVAMTHSVSRPEEMFHWQRPDDLPPSEPSEAAIWATIDRHDPEGSADVRDRLE